MHWYGRHHIYKDLQDAFDTLKKVLTEVLVLAYPDLINSTKVYAKGLAVTVTVATCKSGKIYPAAYAMSCVQNLKIIQFTFILTSNIQNSCINQYFWY